MHKIKRIKSLVHGCNGKKTRAREQRKKKILDELHRNKTAGRNASGDGGVEGESRIFCRAYTPTDRHNYSNDRRFI